MQNFVLMFLINMIISYTFATDEKNTSILDNGKAALRYGFHRTKDCSNFELAFLCIQKCLDLGYDVAHADKECSCTCFTNKVKAKYKNNKYGYKTKWRLGAPTTKHPAWILPLLPDNVMHHEEDDDSDEGEERLSYSIKNDTVSGNDDSKTDDNGTASNSGTPDNNGNLGDHGAAGGDAAPAEGDAAPAEGDAAPAEGDAAPAEGDAAPAEGDAPPAEGDAPPAEGDAPPADDAPPAEE